MKTLIETQNFKNNAVISRFKKEYPEMAFEAELVFKDLMSFFWGTQRHYNDKLLNAEDPSLDFIFIMDEEMKKIDLMWHIFLLYTREYQDFCNEYFGEFIHHQPDIAPGLPKDESFYEQNLVRFLNYGIDNLGEEVISRWFAA